MNTECVLRSKRTVDSTDVVEDAVIKRVSAPRKTQAPKDASPPVHKPKSTPKARTKAKALDASVPPGIPTQTKPDENNQLDVHDPADEPITKFFVERKKLNKKFRKANSLVHHHPKKMMTPLQQKLTNILLRNAQNTEPTRELTWEIQVIDVLRVLKVESRNYEYIEKVILQMMNIKVKWDVLEAKGISKNYSVVFPYTKYLNGVITYEIHDKAAALLTNLESYTSLDMDEEMGLSKSCSIPIYENASRYIGIGHSRWFKWEELRDMVLSSTEVPKNAQTWGAFNERYLGPAIKDVNSKTRLMVQLETEKDGRFVRHVRLTVQKSKSIMSDSALHANSATKGVLVDSMRLLDVPDRTIAKLLRDYDEEQLKMAIAHTKWRRTVSHLKPLVRTAKYFSDSLKNRWYEDSPVSSGIGLSGELFPPDSGTTVDADIQNQPEPVPSKKRSSAKSEKDVGMEKMIQAVKNQRLMNVKVILGELSDVELRSAYAEYNSRILTESMHIKPGRNKAGVMASFHGWYANKTYGQTVSNEEILEHMARMIGSSSKPL